MTRDLRLGREFANAWYGKELEKFRPKADDFTSIVWPTDYWHQIDAEQQEIALKFVEEMEAALDLQRQEISFKEQWQRRPPWDAGDESLYDYMIKATQDMWYDDYHQFDSFCAEYWAKFQKAPYVNPPTRASWESCKSISKTDRDEAKRRIYIFRSWFRDSFFGWESPLIIMPIENVRPRYRDEPPK
ncbi:MAG: hypothetical protein Q9167_002414 [Letrouitia subvulpina]